MGEQSVIMFLKKDQHRHYTEPPAAQDAFWPMSDLTSYAGVSRKIGTAVSCKKGSQMAGFVCGWFSWGMASLPEDKSRVYV